MILSQLDPAQASGILAQLPERMQADVAYRVATMENITPNVIKEIEESLEQQVRQLEEQGQITSLSAGIPKILSYSLQESS